MEIGPPTNLTEYVQAWLTEATDWPLWDLEDAARIAGYDPADLPGVLNTLIGDGLAHAHLQATGLDAGTVFAGPRHAWMNLGLTWIDDSNALPCWVPVVFNIGASCSNPADGCMIPAAPAISEGLLGESSGSRKGGAR
ncbi:hypothetical protein [Isoptericola sp. NPDC019482]|uniref:hypothetical protein n=1 Tax=Isoptericola sp. NPDC019482 TaxID=3154688 RepID=UPI00348DF950